MIEKKLFVVTEGILMADIVNDHINYTSIDRFDNGMIYIGQGGLYYIDITNLSFDEYYNYIKRNEEWNNQEVI